MEEMTIMTAIRNVLEAIPALGKDAENKQQGFPYRSSEAMNIVLHPLFVENWIVVKHEVIDEVNIRLSPKSTQLVTSYKARVSLVCLGDGKEFEVGTAVAQGADTGDKGAGKAMSLAIKYLLLHFFSVPTRDLPDGDREDAPTKPEKRQESDVKGSTSDSTPEVDPESMIEKETALQQLLDLAMGAGLIDEGKAKATMDAMTAMTTVQDVDDFIKAVDKKLHDLEVERMGDIF